MLVLTRKINESLMIGDGIQVTVLEARGGRVKLGIQCAPEIRVHREEVHARIAAEESARLTGQLVCLTE